MKFHVASDLHLEFSGGKFNYTPPECDVVILAGDIHPGVAGIIWASETYNVPTIYIGGNHEFYGKRVVSRHYEKMKEKADELGVHFLQNDTVVIDEVRFIGCTLWTDFNLHGNEPLAKMKLQMEMSDYNQICYYQNRRIIPDMVHEWHKESLAFLEEQLSTPFNGRTVVITHHAPSEMSCIPEFRGNSNNPGYASKLDKFVEIMQPELWVHGHIHHVKDYMIGNTRIVANPRGYRDFNEQTGFNPNLVIEV